jgi:hypothetical protein
MGCDSSNPVSSDGSTVDGVTSISGEVSDGPIKNAKVFIDENLNGIYDLGEPTVLTDENGQYSIPVVADSVIGKYLVVAESTDDSTDEKDNNGVDLNFTMFSVVSTDSQNLNPTEFRKVVKSYEDLIAFDDNKTKDFKDSNESNDTTLFQNHLNNNKSNYQELLASIALKLKQEENSFNNSNEDLGLDENITLSYSDLNLSALREDPLYQDKTVAKIGDLVVSKDLTDANLTENNDTDGATEGVTASSVTNNYYNGNSTNSMVVLKKPILTPVGTDKVKVILGNKSNLNQSITLFVTPYDNLLDIPEYAQLRDAGHEVVVGADITVKGVSDKKKLNLADVNISGVVFDGHTELNASELSYMYFDGTSWVDDNLSVGDSFNGLNSGFKLVPYILVKKDALNDTTTTVEVAGLSAIKNPIVIAKGTSNVSTTLGKKILFSTTTDTNSSDYVILDAHSNISSDSLDFRVPIGSTIKEIVILSEELDNVGSNDSRSIKLDVTDNSANLSSKLSVVTDSNLKTSMLNRVIVDAEWLHNNIALEYMEESIDTPPIIGSDDSLDSLSSDEVISLATTIYNKNIANFLSDSENSNEFYDGNLSQTLTWESYGETVTFTVSDRKITITESESNATGYSMSEKEVYDFSKANTITKTKTKTKTEPSEYYDSGSKNTKKSVTLTLSKTDVNNRLTAKFSGSKTISESYSSSSSDSSSSGSYTKTREISGVAVVDFDFDYTNKISIIQNAKFNLDRTYKTNDSYTYDGESSSYGYNESESLKVDQNNTHFSTNGDLNVIYDYDGYKTTKASLQSNAIDYTISYDENTREYSSSYDLDVANTIIMSEQNLSTNTSMTAVD